MTMTDFYEDLAFLSEGESGYQVQVLQSLLQLNGASHLLLTGSFDHATRMAVMRFQNGLMNVVHPGRVCAATWRALLTEGE